MSGPGAVGHLFGTGNWIDGDVLTNPADATVVADSGSLAGSSYLLGTSSWASVDFSYDLQVLNAALTVLYSQRRSVQAGMTDDFNLPNKVTIPQGGRVRIVTVGAITGDCQSSLFIIEVG